MHAALSDHFSMLLGAIFVNLCKCDGEQKRSKTKNSHQKNATLNSLLTLAKLCVSLPKYIISDTLFGNNV